MDKMKLLNDEELDNVAGKATDYVMCPDGGVRINNDAFVIYACHNPLYFVDRVTGKNGLEIGRNPECANCKYYSD